MVNEISPVSTTEPSGDPHLECTYCRNPIQAAIFAYWSSSKGLLSARCPTCHRTMTIKAAAWRRSMHPRELAILFPPAVRSPRQNVPMGVVHAERDRIAGALQTHILGRLFATGLTLQGLAATLGQHEAERLALAVDELDGIIRDIRKVVFGLQLPEAESLPAMVKQ